MTELHPFQIEGVRGIYQFRGRCLLADEMGCGKTIQTLAWIRRISKRRPVIVVCPASVKYVWQDEAARHFNMRAEVLEGRSANLRALPSDIVILNYDILKDWLPLLRKAKPQVIVLDECHYISNHSAQRTKAALKLTKLAKSVIGTSGTPLVNRPIELWTVLKAIRPDLFPDREKFAWRYCKPRFDPRYGWQYDGASHTKELHSILVRECMIRRLKKDVLTELPDKSRRAVPFKLKSYAEYNTAQHDFLKWLRGISAAKANRARRSQALVKVGYLLRLVAKLKIDWTIKWIEEFLESHPGEKLVCFTMHTFVINRLRERFADRCVVVDGSVTGRLRHESVRQFQNNRKTDLFFGNWKAAGVGITLHAACHSAALDLPWTPGALLQGEDRLHRIGQKRKVVMHYLMAMGTIEEKQIKILRQKSKILDAVLNGKAAPEDFDFFKALLKEMARG